MSWHVVCAVVKWWNIQERPREDLWSSEATDSKTPSCRMISEFHCSDIVNRISFIVMFVPVGLHGITTKRERLPVFQQVYNVGSRPPIGGNSPRKRPREPIIMSSTMLCIATPWTNQTRPCEVDGCLHKTSKSAKKREQTSLDSENHNQSLAYPGLHHVHTLSRSSNAACIGGVFPHTHHGPTRPREDREARDYLRCCNLGLRYTKWRNKGWLRGHCDDGVDSRRVHCGCE